MTIYSTLIDLYNKEGEQKLLQELENNEFKRISCGTFTDVYRKDEEDFVVKVCCRHDNTLPRINEPRHKKLKKYFAGYIELSFDSRVGVQNYIIDYFLLGVHERRLIKSFIQKVKGENDLHPGNVGLLNGQIVIFDF